jgi:diguanylate cyclase (GGDEF)-like protein/PAS domain S-box-containing protein
MWMRMASLFTRRFQPHMHRPLWAIRVALVVASTLALAIAWYDLIASVRASEANTLTQIRAQATLQARAAGEAVQATIESFDFALKSARPAALDTPDVLVARGKFVTSEMPSDLLLQLFHIGPDGYLAYSSLGVAPRNFLGDRDYFRELAAADDDRLVVSKPVLGRLTKRWSIQLARAVRREGRFDGVVAIAVSPDVWAQRLLRFEEDPRDTFTLLTGDGYILLRTLDADAHYGKRAPPGRDFRLHPEQQEGHFVAHASIDGVLRQYAWSRLPSGLVMVSGIALDTALAPVRELNRRAMMRGVLQSTLFVLVIAGLLIALMRYERAVRRLGEREEHYRNVLENMAEGLMVLDAENRVVSVNPAFTAITGYGRDEVSGHHASMLSGGRSVEHVLGEASDLARSGHWEGDFDGVRAGGEPYTGHAVISSVNDADGAVRHRVALITDVTERRRKDDEIWRQANFDRLTGLPNRALLTDRLESMLRHARRHASLVAVLFIDLDRFKPVNDQFGHDVGDLLLRQVARRLLTVFREEDTVARIGGDEFVVVMQGEEFVGGCERAANEVVGRLSQPFTVDGRTFEIGCSVGIARFPANGDGAEALINAADRAMYRAKNGGRGRWSQ